MSVHIMSSQSHIYTLMKLRTKNDTRLNKKQANEYGKLSIGLQFVCYILFFRTCTFIHTKKQQKLWWYFWIGKNVVPHVGARAHILFRFYFSFSVQQNLTQLNLLNLMGNSVIHLSIQYLAIDLAYSSMCIFIC